MNIHSLTCSDSTKGAIGYPKSIKNESDFRCVSKISRCLFSTFDLTVIIHFLKITKNNYK